MDGSKSSEYVENAISLRKKVGYLIGIFLSMGTNQRWDIMGISSTSISCCFDGPKGWCPTGPQSSSSYRTMGFSRTSQPSSYWESGILQFSEAPGPVAANSLRGPHGAAASRMSPTLTFSARATGGAGGKGWSAELFFFLRKK